MSQSDQNYEQPPRTSQNSDIQSHFSVLKIGRIFPKKICKECWTRRPTFLCPFYVGSVHDFGRSDGDII